jgi:hypothetical protein
MWGVCAAVTLAVLLALAVTIYFLFPRMPTLTRKGESDVSLSLLPFAINFTENFVIDNPNYVSLSVHVRCTALHCLHRLQQSLSLCAQLLTSSCRMRWGAWCRASI